MTMATVAFADRQECKVPDCNAGDKSPNKDCGEGKATYPGGDCTCTEDGNWRCAR